jgi:perosamine synthetase
MSLGESVLESLRSVVGPDSCGLHEPKFEGNEIKYLTECIDSTFVSSVGPFVDRFENELASYTRAKHVIATINGTAALHIALLLAGVQPGDEVIVPTLSFVATANAVSFCGAVPHFVDSNERTLGMDPEALRAWLQESTDCHGGLTVNRHTGRCIRAVVPMHTFGHPCEMRALLQVAADFNLALVEDAAESLGSWYQGRHTGTFGLLGTLSFNGNKTITTGGGGAILTNDSDLAHRARHLTTTAKVPHRWEYVHDEVGYNYRMPNLNAALGCAQLEQLPEFLSFKRKLTQTYREAFSELTGARLFLEPEDCKSNYWLQSLLLDEPDVEQRNSVLATTNEAGIMTRPAWTLLHALPPYLNCPRAPLLVAEDLEKRIINLPSNAGLA